MGSSTLGKPPVSRRRSKREGRPQVKLETLGTRAMTDLTRIKRAVHRDRTSQLIAIASAVLGSTVNALDGINLDPALINTLRRAPQQLVGHAINAAASATVIAAVDQVLVHRDALINGSPSERQFILLTILKTSGVVGAGAIPLTLTLTLALTLMPGLSVVLGPLGLLGSSGAGLRLLSSAFNHPSRQELEAMEKVLGHLQGLIVDLKRDHNGQATITVPARAVG